MNERFKPTTGEVLQTKSKLGCSLQEAQRQAQKAKIMKDASDIDTVSDCRRFLMDLVEVLA
jgi:hypothetical protein